MARAAADSQDIYWPSPGIAGMVGRRDCPWHVAVETQGRDVVRLGGVGTLLLVQCVHFLSHPSAYFSSRNEKLAHRYAWLGIGLRGSIVFAEVTEQQSYFTVAGIVFLKVCLFIYQHTISIAVTDYCLLNTCCMQGSWIISSYFYWMLAQCQVVACVHLFKPKSHLSCLLLPLNCLCHILIMLYAETTYQTLSA